MRHSTSLRHCSIPEIQIHTAATPTDEAKDLPGTVPEICNLTETEKDYETLSSSGATCGGQSDVMISLDQSIELEQGAVGGETKQSPDSDSSDGVFADTLQYQGKLSVLEEETVCCCSMQSEEPDVLSSKLLCPVVNVPDAKKEADLSTSCPFSERSIKHPTSLDSCISVDDSIIEGPPEELTPKVENWLSCSRFIFEGQENTQHERDISEKTPKIIGHQSSFPFNLISAFCPKHSSHLRKQGKTAKKMPYAAKSKKEPVTNGYMDEDETAKTSITQGTKKQMKPKERMQCLQDSGNTKMCTANTRTEDSYISHSLPQLQSLNSCPLNLNLRSTNDNQSVCTTQSENNALMLSKEKSHDGLYNFNEVDLSWPVTNTNMARDEGEIIPTVQRRCSAELSLEQIDLDLNSATGFKTILPH